MTASTASSILAEAVRQFAQRAEELTEEALRFAPRGKIAAQIKSWVPFEDRTEEEVALLTLVMTQFETALALMLPSSSGATAIDRLLRQRPRGKGDEALYAALAKASFRLLRCHGDDGVGALRCEDIACPMSVRLFVGDLGHFAQLPHGTAIAAYTIPFDGHGFVRLGPVVPLFGDSWTVAEGFIRPGKGLANPYRCAEAIYRHMVRHGGDEGFPFGGEPADDFPYDPESSELDALAFAWIDGDPEEPELIAAARALTDQGQLIEALSTGAFARDRGRDDLAEAYIRIARVQMETLQRRAASGMGISVQALEEARSALDLMIAHGRMPSHIRDLFDEVRRGIRFAGAGSRGDGDLDALIRRIQALRERTTERGCTEQEALAAAAKVAELLDRYGLSLSELDLRQQSCTGVGIETGRRRSGPLDDCAHAVAAFFDCRHWTEVCAHGFMRHIFFGLPADVEAAHYLYNLIEAAFATETALFQSGEVYLDLPSRRRRSGTNSFQVGLGHGIATKLGRLHDEREAAMIRSGGRDLVPVKAAVVDEELDKLGLDFRHRRAARGRRVLTDAFHAGREAGERFEVHHGIGKARASS